MWLIYSKNSQSCVCLWYLWSILIMDHKGGGNNLNSSFTPNTLSTLGGNIYHEWSRLGVWRGLFPGKNPPVEFVMLGASEALSPGGADAPRLVPTL